MEETQIILKDNCLEKLKNALPRILGILFVLGISVLFMKYVIKPANWPIMGMVVSLSSHF